MFWKSSVLFKQHLILKLVAAFPLKMHRFVYYERKFFLFFFSAASVCKEMSLSSEVFKQCSGVEHGTVERKNRSVQGRRLRKGEIFLFQLSIRGRCLEFAFM